MSTPHLGPGIGTRLRHLLEMLDGDVAKVYTDLGLDGFRPRFTPVVGTLVRLGPMPIRDLARALSVTHSAASQTVAQMSKDGLVTLEPGADARQRIVHLTPKAEALLPALEAEWNATEAASREFDAELPFSLTELVEVATRALEERPFRERITATAEARRLAEFFPEKPKA